MCQATIIATEDGHVLGVHAWTEGFKPLKCPVRRSEKDFVAHLSYLVHHGRRELANDLLERYCSGDVSVLVLVL